MTSRKQRAYDDGLTLEYELEPKKKEIERNKTITVKYSSCCGCGCSDVKVRVIVPESSPLKDGSKVTVQELDKLKRA